MIQESRDSFFRKKILKPILEQLKQGITPKKIALTIALGIALGIFPIIGSTTLLCFIAALAFRLNQPTIQLTNYLIYPVQILFLPIFVRLGELLLGAERISFSVAQLRDEFLRNPYGFLRHFGLAGLHGIVAWTLVSPLIILIFYFPILFAINQIPSKKNEDPLRPASER